MRLCNNFVLLTVTVCLFVMANMAVGQEEPPSQFEHIKGLEPFVGVWQGEIPSEEGASQKLTVLCRLTSNKSYATFSLSSQTDDERKSLGTILVGWDAPNKQLTMWGFWPDRQAKGKASIEGNTLSYSATAALPDGSKSTAEVTFKVSKEEMNVKVTNRRRGNSEEPDLDINLKRRERREGGR